MKKFILTLKRLFLLLILLAVAVPAFSGGVTLSWDPSPTPGVTGYVAYYGNSPENLQYSRDVGNVLTAKIDDLSPGDWYFAVTAYNPAEESAYSNMVDKTIDGFVPPNVPHEPITIPVPAGTVTVTIKVE
jgi:hypothetical protein